jgi:uncharacterized membrane protein YeaQ/YmgE (transglycosylase-associated protein family)
MLVLGLHVVIGLVIGLLAHVAWGRFRRVSLVDDAALGGIGALCGGSALAGMRGGSFDLTSGGIAVASACAALVLFYAVGR